MRRSAILVLAVLLAAPAVFSGDLAGVSLPDEVTVSDATLQLNGMGLRKKMWVKVYVAGLYVAESSDDAVSIVGSSSPKKVVMHFLTNKATKKKMDAAWVEGFEKNSPVEFAKMSERVDTFKDLFGDMKVGDQVELTIVPGGGTAVVLNGEQLGTIDGDDFGAALLRVWLGDNPPSADLKKGLLGT